MCCPFVVSVLLLWPVPGTATVASVFNVMPFSRLAPAQLQPGLCTLSYRISTQSEECQKFFDQGLAYFYSYGWTEAARSFETAARHDPQCAMCWLGLSRSLQQWGARASRANDALKKGYELLRYASHPEQQLILARAIERGIAKDAPTDASARKLKAQSILDELLMLHPDDEEAWMARGILESNNAFFGGKPVSAPYYLALTKINPVHPGANHELLHQYETTKRPALGWVYSEKYIESSPGLPHAWHMQGHLSTRLGRWEHAADQALKAIALERQHNQKYQVKPHEDHQWSHHLETCMEILTHQGRYREARQIYDEMRSLKFNKPEVFAAYFLAAHDTVSMMKWIEENRTKSKYSAAYFAALLYLEQGDLTKAKIEIDVLETGLKTDTKEIKVAQEVKPITDKPAEAKPTIAKSITEKKDETKDKKTPETKVTQSKDSEKKPNADKKLEMRYWETRGTALCKSGMVEQGLVLLKKAADASKGDYAMHAWGHGAYYLESWGIAALAARNDTVAEEAFLEAIAHDPGSFRGALGMQILCERLGRSAEAKQYQSMAEKAWQHADVKTYLEAVTHLRQLTTHAATVSTGNPP